MDHALARLGDGAERLSRADAEVVIGDLTFDEAKELERRLDGMADRNEIARTIEGAGATATVRQPLSDQDSGNDWRARIAAEESRIRVRGYEF